METCLRSLSDAADGPRPVAADVALGHPIAEPAGPRSITYISYGTLTATRAHNLQTVHTLNALIEEGVRVTFINPILDESPLPKKERNLPAGRNLLLRGAWFFRRH